MTADPLGWLQHRLEDLGGLLEEAGMSPEDAPKEDGEELRRAAPDIVAAVDKMLEAVRNGELARPPADAGDFVRTGWL
jgi:hypothetical protein